MPFEQSITIINNSGKIISTGKHLVNILKDAKAAYKEKKYALRAEQNAPATLQRAKTFDVVSRAPSEHYYYQHPGYEYGPPLQLDEYDRATRVTDRRRSIDDGRSRTAPSTVRSRRHRASSQHRPALTESNLKTLSEVSSAAPSAVPKGYRSPYAETASRALTMSRPTLLTRTNTMPYASSAALDERRYAPETAVEPVLQSGSMYRPPSDPALRPNAKEIDMDLAYGNIPPDLATRVDLDPNYKNSPEMQEAHARSLMARVEELLVEAQCVHHTATHIITHLQGNPEAAAAVALTLAELSAILGKLSPAFLGVVKGGSPAVFALLASPQFLIAAGVAVGVTVVMFGGWKIVKRIKEANKAKEQPMAVPAPMSMPMPEPTAFTQEPYSYPYPADAESFDEALVLEDELSTIESWRRGIVAGNDDAETAEIELMSPEAERTIIERRRGRDDDGIEPSDSVSQLGRSTTRSHRSSKTHRSHKSRRHDEPDVPDRKSSKLANDGVSARDRDRDDRSRSGRSETSHRSSRHGSSADSASSKRREKVTLRAIEDGSKEEGNTLEAVLRPKEKKNPSMLKALFKKRKDKEDGDKARVQRSVVSVMV